MSMFRGFIAVDINAIPGIIQLLDEIKSSNADVKLVESQNIHITLKFLGDVQKDKINKIEEIIKKSTEGIKPFKIKLNGTGVYPNKNYIRVIWIGIKDTEKLAIIAKNIDQGTSHLGFKKEKRDFSAHLTLGRVKTSKNKEILLKKIENYEDFDFGLQDVNSIKFKKSD